MRNACLLILLVSSYLSIQGQSLKINLGSNFSKINQATTFTENFFQHNGVIGIEWEQPVNSFLAASLEMQYSTKGYRTKGAEFLGQLLPNGHNNLRLQYIDILPTISGRINSHFAILAGANVGFKVVETFNGVTTPTPMHKTIDYGILGGFRVNANKYSLRFIANQGLINTANEFYVTDQNGQNEKLVEYKNINLQLTLGVKIIDLQNREI